MDPPMTGQFFMHEEEGVYHCKNCNQLLFDSHSKFHSGSGWPSFDEALEHAIVTSDSSQRGKDVHCQSCGQFLGKLVLGEGFTENDRRYDINSSALQFKKKAKEPGH